MSDFITVTVKLFAAYQDAYGASEIALELPEGATVEQVCDRILRDRPQLVPLKSITQFGVNLEFVSPDTIVKNGDEIVLIPPVSGG
ncbi:MAG: MoaD/ThiS family protein [Plectolyngbya sp. WJT66-NPBG17]|jgi:molybdopterin synthase sulfur carrier subunit|nr:MoaD/ThiS family protein [Plectolyngbya sp. WJT66-NPBG17]MBW4524298.1 MoaD/ThiS family protein [Phormidium tanganyikae FI6-MK23]